MFSMDMLGHDDIDKYTDYNERLKEWGMSATIMIRSRNMK